MSYVDWYVEGLQFSSCNCTYACPCQFALLPSTTATGAIKFDLNGTYGQFSRLRHSNKGVVHA